MLTSRTAPTSTSSAARCKRAASARKRAGAAGPFFCACAAAGQRGFTLAETAIVLVIIGLLVGSILKAQEMIVQARIKNVIADFAGVSAAYYGYQDRYRAVPGDDAGARSGLVGLDHTGVAIEVFRLVEDPDR